MYAYECGRSVCVLIKYLKRAFDNMQNKIEELRNTKNRREFAALLGVTYPFLNYIIYAKNTDTQYTEFEIPKKTGGKRKIHAPNEELKDIQRRLSNLLLDCKHLIHDTNLSHGFERRRSIITNANRHTKKSNVLNIDLEDFFDSFNFGRVRGFFLKNNDFKLEPEVATTIAKIACYENTLPQGSPCSPVIANLITNILDVYLNKITKKYGCSYSRYADDITISTRKRKFPNEIVEIRNSEIIIGREILAEIERAGFQINNKKIRVQFKDSRQDTTGLIVNKKVNVKNEYWRTVRAMANNLFKEGIYIVDGKEQKELAILEGKLSFIDSIDKFNNILPKPHKTKPYYQSENLGLNYLARLNIREKTYSKFLYYKYFHANKFPTILTEGKTDILYLRCALDKLVQKYPLLSKITSTENNCKRWPLTFFHHSKKTKYLLDLEGGSISLKKFVERYNENYEYYSNQKASSPVILVLDNDSGQNCKNGLLTYLTKNLKGNDKEIKKTEIRNAKFYHICHNLYMILTPLNEERETAMEDLFEQSVLDTIIDGKKFNKSNDECTDTEYGKVVFAVRVVREKASVISFEKFNPIFEAISEIIIDYNKKE